MMELAAVLNYFGHLLIYMPQPNAAFFWHGNGFWLRNLMRYLKRFLKFKIEFLFEKFKSKKLTTFQLNLVKLYSENVKIFKNF